jgi:hypothetical protein
MIEYTDRWAGRNELIARLIPQGSSVLDLGCGARGLELLIPSCTYTGVDQPDFDMNRGRWPKGRYDVAVMSGVLECARFPAAAFRHLHDLVPLAFVSYSHGGRRRERSWVNDLSVEELQELAAKAGWTAEPAGEWVHRHLRPQTVWRFT